MAHEVNGFMCLGSLGPMLWAQVLVMFGVGARIIVQHGASGQSGVAAILGRRVEARSKFSCTLKNLFVINLALKYD